MNKFNVMSIPDMIDRYREFDNIKVIVITKSDYHYPFEPLLKLDFQDITPNDIETLDDKSKFTLIQDRHIDAIVDKLDDIRKSETIFVCCDAGISRSPAVASALAHYLGDAESYGYLTYRYPFANHYVFEKVLTGIRQKINSKLTKN